VLVVERSYHEILQNNTVAIDIRLSELRRARLTDRRASNNAQYTNIV